MTVPHQLDREVAEALPALWYFLHLPRVTWELIDLPLEAIERVAHHRPDHHTILLAPIEAFDAGAVPNWPGPGVRPALVVSPDGLIAEASRVSSDLGCLLPPLAISALSDDTLKQHWQGLHQRLVPSTPFVGGSLELVRRLDIAPLELPVRRLARQLAHGLDNLPRADVNPLEWVKTGLRQHAFVRVFAQLEAARVSPAEAEQLADPLIDKELQSVSVPVAVGATGVAPAYERGLRAATETSSARRQLAALDPEDTFGTDLPARPDHLVERAAVELLVTHSAVRDGLGMMAGGLSPELFSTFRTLEQHWTARPTAGKVWRLLDRLDQLAAPMWTEPVAAAVGRASQLTAFSNFPLGVLRFPGDTAPLSCRVPIAYRPLSPLTRAIQLELSSRIVDLTSGFRVLVAECIPPEDPVGQMSRRGWDVGEEMFQADAAHNSTIVRVNVRSPAQLVVEIRNAAPDVLVLSAHGVSNGALAGIMVGDQVCHGPELGEVPPVVVLSACHVAPRGEGAVTVADLLLRQGALTVLGPHVPVDVRRNAILTVRLFVYMTQSIAGVEQHESLLHAWWRTQTGNAVVDILNGNSRFASWASATTTNGLPVLTDFMSHSSKGRLRQNHIYKDSEQVLVELADGMAMGDRVRQWLRTPGYAPESAFYALIGRPEQVVLRMPPSHRSTSSGDFPRLG